MRGLTLHQPWAALLVIGEKRLETRPRRISYRGWVAIHASKAPVGVLHVDGAQAALERHGLSLDSLPRGAVLAVGKLEAVAPVEDVALVVGRAIQAGRWPRDELRFGDFSPGRWAWHFTTMLVLSRPYPLRGMQGLFPIAPRDQVAIRELCR